MNEEFKKHITGLTEYLKECGWNISPYPSLIVRRDNAEASSLFGKTAYYEPVSKTVVLYTAGRHPKDILRSYAHEMIHRIQDNEGRLNNIGTTNTNEDGHLEDIEKEAYQKGNIMLRNWEDSIKNV